MTFFRLENGKTRTRTRTHSTHTTHTLISRNYYFIWNFRCALWPTSTAKIFKFEYFCLFSVVVVESNVSCFGYTLHACKFDSWCASACLTTLIRTIFNGTIEPILVPKQNDQKPFFFSLEILMWIISEFIHYYLHGVVMITQKSKLGRKKIFRVNLSANLILWAMRR